MQAYCRLCEQIIDLEGARTVQVRGTARLIITSDGKAHSIQTRPKSKKVSPVNPAEGKEEDKDVE